MRSRTFSAILILATSFLSGAAQARREVCADALAELEKIAKTYSIKIGTGDRFPIRTTYGLIEGKDTEVWELPNYTSLFGSEFCLYPTDLIKRTKLKRVVICSDLSYAGQLRNAIPDFEHDTLYLDGSRGSYDNTYLRKVIHHEFYHIIDYRHKGLVYRDERWASLNPVKFNYGNGGRANQNVPEASVLTDKFPGFLNYYSTTAVEEDKAEVFANLIVDLEYVEQRVKTDRILDAKVERMKEQLEKFCPDMNNKFWEKIRKMKRTDK